MGMKESSISTVITHKRGVLSDQVIRTIKDGQVFYDISNPSAGIYIGQYNRATGKIDAIHLANLGGTISPEELARIIEEIKRSGVVLKTDIVNELNAESIYTQEQVLGAIAAQRLKADITGINTRLTEVERLISTGGILTKESLVTSDSIDVNKKADGTISFDVKWKSYSK